RVGDHLVSMTATTADPISLIRNAPHEAIAVEFALWTLSPEAQRLWQRARGTEGGPHRFELRRMPIRSDMYTSDEMQYWTDQDLHPFESAIPIVEAMPDFFGQVAPLTHAMAMDIHNDL